MGMGQSHCENGRQPLDFTDPPSGNQYNKRKQGLHNWRWKDDISKFLKIKFLKLLPEIEKNESVYRKPVPYMDLGG